MNWVRKRIFFAFFLLPTLYASGQVNLDFSIAQDLFYKNYYLMNAANPDTSTGPELTVSNRSLTGVFEGISQNFLSFQTTIATQNQRNKHGLGFYIHNDNQGQYIQNNRLYARYAYTTSLGFNSSLSLGAQLGVVNYFFESSIASGGGSDFAPDLGVGIWLLTDVLDIGLSANQLLNTNLRPLTQTYILNRYYTLTAKKAIMFSPELLGEFHAMVITTEDFEINAQFTPVVVFKELVEVGAGYHYDKGILANLGLRNVAIGEGKLLFNVSYQVLNTRKSYNQFDASLEFFLGYQF